MYCLRFILDQTTSLSLRSQRAGLLIFTTPQTGFVASIQWQLVIARHSNIQMTHALPETFCAQGAGRHEAKALLAFILLALPAPSMQVQPNSGEQWVVLLLQPVDRTVAELLNTAFQQRSELLSYSEKRSLQKSLPTVHGSSAHLRQPAFFNVRQEFSVLDLLLIWSIPDDLSEGRVLNEGVPLAASRNLMQTLAPL